MIEKKNFLLEIYPEKAILKLDNSLFDNSINFQIPLEKIDNINYNEDNNKIANLQKQNEIFRNEIEKLKKKIEAKFNIQTNEINIEETINKMVGIFQESELTKNECYLLYNWLNKNKNLKFIKLYSTKKDGDNPSKFHEKCDGKNPTITIIKTKKGYRFGGYTTIPWVKSSV